MKIKVAVGGAEKVRVVNGELSVRASNYPLHTLTGTLSPSGKEKMNTVDRHTIFEGGRWNGHGRTDR